MNLVIYIASISYALSIFVDVFVWFIRYYCRNLEGIRYLLSLSNIFQYSARGFVLVFTPLMSYYTDKVNNPELIWNATVISHIFVVLFLLWCLLSKDTQRLAHRFIYLIDKVQKNKLIDLKIKKENQNYEFKRESIIFIIIVFIASLLYCSGITLIYYISFDFPDIKLMLSSYSQIINMVGSMIFILLVDSRLYSCFDKNEGYNEVISYGIGRIFAHFVTIAFLLFI